MHNLYESDDLLNQYLLFHYASKDAFFFRTIFLSLKPLISQSDAYGREWILIYYRVRQEL